MPVRRKLKVHFAFAAYAVRHRAHYLLLDDDAQRRNEFDESGDGRSIYTEYGHSGGTAADERKLGRGRVSKRFHAGETGPSERGDGNRPVKECARAGTVIR